jgi:Mn2+/Fe2+ NRAMP family transporter
MLSGISELLQEQTAQNFLMFSPFILIVILAALGLASLILLWTKGKRLEALSLFNSFLLTIIIVLIISLH